MLCALTRGCLRAPLTAAALLLAVMALAGVGVSRLESAAGYRALLGDRHPALQQLDSLLERFGSGLTLAAVWSCDETPICASVLDDSSLEMARALADALLHVDGVARVDSPATSPLWISPPIGLPERKSFAEPGLRDEERRALRDAALLDETWRHQIISPDASAGALVVHLDDSLTDTGVEVVETLRRALVPYENAGFRFALVGGPVEFVVAGAELENASATMIPAMICLAGLLLLLLFRRPAPALITLVGVGAAVLVTLGAQGAFGWPQTSFSQALPPLVLVIGLCDSIHLLEAYTTGVCDGSDRPARVAAMEGAAQRVGAPCLYTTLTTAAGFLSFTVADLESFVRFGAVAAWGVAAALLLSFSLVPLLAVSPPAAWMRSAPAQRLLARIFGQLGRCRRRHAAAITGATALVALATSAALPGLETEARFDDIYGAQSQVVRWVHAAERHLRSPETLEVVIELPDALPPDSPQALAVLRDVESASFSDRLGPSLSILSPMRTAHRLLHREPLAQAVAHDPSRLAEMARFVHLKAPDDEALFVDRDDAAYRLSLQAGKLPQRELRALLRDTHGELGALLPPNVRATLGGPLATVSQLLEAIRGTQQKSFALAAVLIALLTAYFLRSPALALAGLAPALLSVVTTLGTMAFLGFALDVGSAMVATVVLGIAVDDAIHFLHSYRAARRADHDSAAALDLATRTVGGALITTSLALAAGFCALALSPWATVSRFGAVTAGAIAVALVATLVVLPALLTLFHRTKR